MYRLLGQQRVDRQELVKALLKQYSVLPADWVQSFGAGSSGSSRLPLLPQLHASRWHLFATAEEGQVGVGC
jgi:hypothetical protein